MIVTFRSNKLHVLTTLAFHDLFIVGHFEPEIYSRGIVRQINKRLEKLLIFFTEDSSILGRWSFR